MTPGDRDTEVLGLRVVGVDVVIEGEPAAVGLLRSVYGGMSGVIGPPALTYTIGSWSGQRELCRGPVRVGVPTDADLLWEFDHDLIVEVQRQRSNLYFIHAAVLEHRGRALLVVAPSGTGKSTLAWTLVHCGPRYLSDELAPIDLRRLTVQPFPRALCLKDEPRSPYGVPPATVWTDEALHIGVEALPSPVGVQAIPIAAIFFLRRPEPSTVPSVKRLATAEGAQRLYSNALNPLAHVSAGLPGAVGIASACPCFELIAADPADTAALALRAIDVVEDRLAPSHSL